MDDFKAELKLIASTRVAWFLAGMYAAGGHADAVVAYVRSLVGG